MRVNSHRSTGQTQNGSAGTVKAGDSSHPPDEAARDVLDFVMRVTSPEKAKANRNNARKSTGPRTRRGKSHSRLNALKHGAFASRRLIPGENREEYDDLAVAVIGEVAPCTAIETMLVDQIIGDIWRLRRVEQAELAYFGEVRKATISRALRSLPCCEHRASCSAAGDEKPPLSHCATTAGNKSVLPKLAVSNKWCDTEHVKDAGSSGAQVCEETLRFARQKLDIASDLDKLMLDGLVSPQGAFPQATLEHIRRSLVRDVLRKGEKLAELQCRPPKIAFR